MSQIVAGVSLVLWFCVQQLTIGHTYLISSITGESISYNLRYCIYTLLRLVKKHMYVTMNDLIFINNINFRNKIHCTMTPFPARIPLSSYNNTYSTYIGVYGTEVLCLD